ncbi:putative hydrolase [Selenomonas ruminantium subsp. lactilytica TAM6421]|uniref:Putative hydrolase n=1 Tax=Selenomonas ruminantium subsp. lactilytica (strain NBRC 103574 / TAM6421) TaxID=927704 RepID=I0GUQ8_SELRL|nr:5'-nucleotidase C-terminal domain-containing protein [Selenomonas ruminantium]BAL84495.1 putative hydrolase [Selenomonas ruminantium subsp. lactilytica TAM6421]
MFGKRSLKTMALAALSAAITSGTAFAGDLTVFSTSDIHGSVIGWNYFTAQPANLGLAKVSTIIKQARSQKGPNDDILVVDGGDILQGTPLDTYMVQHPNEWKTHPMFDAFNTIGYDAIELGNHEFNFGLDYLKKAIGSNKNVLGANVIEDKTGKTWSGVRPYLMKTVTIDGEKVNVGIIGTDTPAIPMFEDPSHFAGVHFADQVPVFQQCVKELKAQGADIIIGITHSGVPRNDRSGAENQVVDIAKACPELSLLVCAHNHVVIDNKSGITGPDGTQYADSVINGVPVVESGKDGKFVGKSVLTINKVNGKWQVEKVATQALSTKGVEDDPQIIKQVKPWHEKTLKHLQTVIGKASAEYSGTESNHQDSAIVDLVNEVQRHYAGTQLSASASFNTSQNISKDDITLQEMSGLYIYENYLYGIEINGAELRKYMEHAASFYGTSPDYNYDMLQGVDYTIDMTKPVGQRITKLQYQGKDVKDSDKFTLAINDYRMNGGSGYMDAMGYTNGKKPKIVFDSMRKYGDDGQMRNLMIRYVQEKGTITPSCDHNWNVIK